MSTNRTPVDQDPRVVAIREKRRKLTQDAGPLQIEAVELCRMREGEGQYRPPERPLTERQKAVLEKTARLLNGSAPSDLMRPSTGSREAEVLIELDAFSACDAFFAKQEQTALIAVATERVKQLQPQFKAMAKSFVLSTVRVQTLNDLAYEIIRIELRNTGVCDFPLTNYIGNGALFGDGTEDPLRELKRQAIQQNVLSQADIDNEVRRVRKEF